jgi:glucose-1-phosphate adenylyltransferase
MNYIVILAGGASTRMKASSDSGLSKSELSAANSGNKGLIILEGQTRPVLDYLIKNAVTAGFNIIVLVTGQDQQAFLEFYDDALYNKNNLGAAIVLAKQIIPAHRSKPWGTADALLQAMNQVVDLQTAQFAVCNCDNLYSQNALSLLQDEATPNALIAYDRVGLEFKASRIATFAAMHLDANNCVLDIVEKPKEETLESYRDNSGSLRVSMNLFKFNGTDIYPTLLNCPENALRGEKELPTALLNMIKSGTTVKGIPLKEHVPDLTSKEDIGVFKKYLNSNGI